MLSLPTEEVAASTVNLEPQPNKGWGSVRFEYTYDRIVEKQRDTPVPAGTCCLGPLSVGIIKDGSSIART
jgi:hypothetical protein